eukprot:TRINITY_DN597_c0_g1_i2.p1 TRINITY_DN597_c0_g1~~TRINITY_DN597_c0_g1_i2.p1  ORF type:complete len:284 (-),score=27.14 TRINITY_DN597_c0_g1_i2:875-1726(-)
MLATVRLQFRRGGGGPGPAVSSGTSALEIHGMAYAHQPENIPFRGFELYHSRAEAVDEETHPTAGGDEQTTAAGSTSSASAAAAPVPPCSRSESAKSERLHAAVQAIVDRVCELRNQPNVYTIDVRRKVIAAVFDHKAFTNDAVHVSLTQVRRGDVVTGSSSAGGDIVNKNVRDPMALIMAGPGGVPMSDATRVADLATEGKETVSPTMAPAPADLATNLVSKGRTYVSEESAEYEVDMVSVAVSRPSASADYGVEGRRTWWCFSGEVRPRPTADRGPHRVSA